MWRGLTKTTDSRQVSRERETAGSATSGQTNFAFFVHNSVGEKFNETKIHGNEVEPYAVEPKP